MVGNFNVSNLVVSGVFVKQKYPLKRLLHQQKSSYNFSVITALFWVPQAGLEPALALLRTGF